MDVLRSRIQSSYMELREDAARENLCPESHVKRSVSRQKSKYVNFPGRLRKWKTEITTGFMLVEVARHHHKSSAKRVAGLNV